MEIQFKSEFFKYIYNSESFVDEFRTRTILSFSDDEKVPRVSRKEHDFMVEDYEIVMQNTQEPCSTNFSHLPQELIKAFISKGIKSPALKILNGQFDFSCLDDIDGIVFENIEDIQFSGIKSRSEEKTKFKHASCLKNLSILNLINCESLDIDDFFKSLPEPEKLTQLMLSDNFPSIETIMKFTGLRSIHIQNVEDSEKLARFLTALPLELLENITLIKCNLSKLSPELIGRLKSVEDLQLVENKDADYNVILDLLPNQDLLKKLNIRNNSEEEFEIDVLKLKKFIRLSNLSVSQLSFKPEDFRDFLSNSRRFTRVVDR